MKKYLLALTLLAAGVMVHAQSDVPVSATPPATRGGAPSPYSAPISVPSAAGQIPAPGVVAPNITFSPVPPPPAFTSSCDGGGCWGADGTRYNSVGGSLVNPAGKVCLSVAGMVQCP